MKDTHLDGVLQGLAVHLVVLLLDVAHVNLTPGHHQADESTVPGAHPSHGVVQLLGEVSSTVLDAVVLRVNRSWVRGGVSMDKNQRKARMTYITVLAGH